MKPRDWTEIYPQDTQEGNEEQQLFIALSRKKYKWRSISALVRESKLSQERVMEIIKKYQALNMIIQDPDHEDQFGYWTRVPDHVPKFEKKSVARQDQENRIKKIIEENG